MINCLFLMIQQPDEKALGSVVNKGASQISTYFNKTVLVETVLISG